MNIGRLVLQEIRYRFLNFLLGALSILAATGCLVAAVQSLNLQETRIQKLADKKKQETAGLMKEFEDETRRNMLKLGFNVLVVHKDENRERLLAGQPPAHTLPESYVAALTGSEAKDGQKRESGVLNLNHLLPILREDLVWENRAGVRNFAASLGLNASPVPALPNLLNLTNAATKLRALTAPVILTGTPGEVPIIGKTEKRPLIPVVPPGGILLGPAIQRAMGVNAGEVIELHLLRESRYGKEIVAEPLPPARFKVYRAQETDRARGNEHDVTMWVNLDEAQKLLRKPGLITGIFALECVSPECPTDRFHDVESELARLLPGTQVVPHYSIAAVRAAARSKQAALTARSIDNDINQGKKLKQQHEEFAAILVPIVVLACIVWLGVLAFSNVRDRVTEIGILRALGVRNWQVLALFLSKALVIGLVGGMAGYVLGILVCQLWIASGGEHIAFLQPVVLLIVLIGAPVIGVLASIMPAVWAARQDPAVILQQE